MLKLQIPINSAGDVFEFVLDEPAVTVGRRHDNDIRIKETYVSAYHATVIRGGDGTYFLRDRDSSNGTFHNGKRITDQVEVREGDTLKFGKLDCWVVGANLSESKLPAPPSSGPSRKSRHLPFKDAFKTAAFKTLKRNGSGKSPESQRASESNTGVVTPPSFADQALLAPQSNESSEQLDLLNIEINSLNKQLTSNQSELEQTKAKLIQISRELSEERNRSRKLESAVKVKDTENNRISRQLRSEKIRADELEDDLARTQLRMSNQIKGIEAKLELARNDNNLLQGTLDILEAEHKKHTQDSLELAEKLKATREGFSPLLQHSDEEPEGDKQFDHAQSQVELLEAELGSIRSEFKRMESGYEKRLRLTSEAKNEAARVASELEQELGKARTKLRDRQSNLIHLQESRQSFEMDPGEDDIYGTMAESGRLGEWQRLQNSTSNLEQENENLYAENKFLAAKVEQSEREKEAQAALFQKNQEEIEESAHKLEEILQKLNDSEKRVKDLRKLETELEKSVQRAQRSALSRKGIYSEEGESSTVMWPETEELICRELIERVELLEDLLRQYQGRWFFPKVADQLNLLRDSFMVLLKNHSVDQFDLEPGTELSVESRARIHLISVDEVGDPKLKRKSIQNLDTSNRTTVLQTKRPGYVYRNGGQDVIIRKAEVVVA